MAALDNEGLLVVGSVVRPQGLKGLLRVASFSGEEGSWRFSERLYLRRAPAEGPREFRVLEARPHRGCLLVRLEGLATIDEAEGFRGAEVLVEKAALRKADDEYFWHELMGLSVFSESLDYLGKITGIIQTGSNDVYVVTLGDREILIPATHEVVKEIDLKGGKMVVSPLEGLLDPDAV